MRKVDTVKLSVKVPARILNDIELIAEYLVSEDDVKAVWGDKENKSYILDLAIKRWAADIRKKRENKHLG